MGSLARGERPTIVAEVGIPGAEMIQPADVVRAVRFLLELSPMCVVCELVIDRVQTSRTLPASRAVSAMFAILSHDP